MIESVGAERERGTGETFPSSGRDIDGSKHKTGSPLRLGLRHLLIISEISLFFCLLANWLEEQTTEFPETNCLRLRRIGFPYLDPIYSRLDDL